MEERIKEIVLKVLPEAEIDTCEDFFDEGLDSMGVMTIIAMIQSTFGIEIAPEDITADNFSNFGEIVRLVDRYGK